MKYPRSIQNLIDAFCQLPTVGPKTAERYVFYLLKQSSEDLQKFAQSIAELKEKITICKHCLAVTDASPCEICSDTKRDSSLVCVVSNTRDLLSIEATKEYNGLYHVLGGAINPIEGVSPDKLTIKQLIKKIEAGKIKEIILALNPNMEGETTALYLTKILKPFKLKVTRLARGLSTGSDLEYADPNTLANALKFRNEL